MDVSIIIVNYNTINILVDCIESVYQKTKDICFEIIVVDNNSSDNSQQILKDKFKDVIYLSLPENVGFGRANNNGVEISKGRNIFFLNPDTILLNNAVKILSDELDSNDDYGVVGGNLFDMNQKPIHSHLKILPGILTDLNELSFGLLRKLFFSKNFEFNYTSSNIEVGYITGADLMISKELFVKIGQFNPAFFMYYEETEMCFRVKKSGLKVINVPTSQIIHLVGGSFDSKKLLNRFKRFINGRRIYYKLVYSSVTTCIADTIFSLSLMERIIWRFLHLDLNECKLLYTKLMVFWGVK